jgi:hypothetical protein
VLWLRIRTLLGPHTTYGHNGFGALFFNQQLCVYHACNTLLKLYIYHTSYSVILSTPQHTSVLQHLPLMSLSNVLDNDLSEAVLNIVLPSLQIVLRDNKAGKQCIVEIQRVRRNRISIYNGILFTNMEASLWVGLYAKKHVDLLTFQAVVKEVTRKDPSLYLAIIAECKVVIKVPEPTLSAEDFAKKSNTNTTHHDTDTTQCTKDDTLDNILLLVSKRGESYYN